MSLFTIKSDKSRGEPGLSEFGSQQPSASSGSWGRCFSLEYGSSIALALLAFGTILIASILSYSYWPQYPAIVKENGLLEDGQGVFLLFACVISLLRFWRIRLSASLNKELFLMLAFATLVILLREVDIDKLGRSPLWPMLEKVVRAIAAVALLGFIFSLLKKIKLLFLNLANFLKTPLVILVIIGALFYICGLPFDRNMFSIEYSLSQLFEEILELNACILFAFAAVARGVKQNQKSL